MKQAISIAIVVCAVSIHCPVALAGHDGTPDGSEYGSGVSPQVQRDQQQYHEEQRAWRETQGTYQTPRAPESAPLISTPDGSEYGYGVSPLVYRDQQQYFEEQHDWRKTQESAR